MSASESCIANPHRITTFTNVLNHTNFAPPAMNIASPSFGVLESALPQGSGGNRTGQLALRLDF